MGRLRALVNLCILAASSGPAAAGCAEDIATSIVATAKAPAVYTSATTTLGGALFADTKPATVERWELRGKVLKQKSRTSLEGRLSRETMLIGTNYWETRDGQDWHKLNAAEGAREHRFWHLANARDRSVRPGDFQQVSCSEPFKDAGVLKRRLQHTTESTKGGFRQTVALTYVVDAATRLVLWKQDIITEHGRPELGGGERVTVFTRQYSYEPIADIVPPLR